MDGEKQGNRKRWNDQHAMVSMAQTRATSKALGQVLRWVPELAGYAGTPAEEMPPISREPTPKPAPPQMERISKEFSGAVDTIKDVLGAQEVNTDKATFGEADTPPAHFKSISEKQAGRAIALAINAGKAHGEHGFHVLNSVLKAEGYETAPHGSNGDDVKLHLCEQIGRGAKYDALCALLEKWVPTAEEEPF